MKRLAISLLLLLSTLAVTFVRAEAQTYSVLYTFKGTFGRHHGASPTGGLTLGGSGSLFGTTSNGGAFLSGTVFKLTANGKEEVLYSFTGGSDGESPQAGLIRDRAGNLYGATFAGGDAAGCGGLGCGTVFKLDKDGVLTVLHTFTDLPDGARPFAGLIQDKLGNLYGTTLEGGMYHGGTIFKIDPSGNETVLYSFTGGKDGAVLYSGVVTDKKHNLYGTTFTRGSHNDGTVFKLDTAGVLTVLHSFKGSDGRKPMASLVRDQAGNFYGTTAAGGTDDAGTVFKIHGHSYSVLHNFSANDGSDGSDPVPAVVLDGSGNLYGTTMFGGTDNIGTVFKLDANGAFTLLHSFGGPDGASPSAPLIVDASGNLYGTTYSGGDVNVCPGVGGSGCGVVFKIAP